MLRLAGRQFDGACVEALVDGFPEAGTDADGRTMRQPVQAV
jgi:hypothetical protein